MGVTKIYISCSVAEAKLVFVNFRVDILLTDIEMPEENGLELFRWAKAEFPQLECIFLTSHANFQYAQKALQLGGFEYILQPCRYVEVENAMKRALEKLIQNNIGLENNTLEIQQKDTFMESILLKVFKDNIDNAIEKLKQLLIILQYDRDKTWLCPIYIRMNEKTVRKKIGSEDLSYFFLRNVLEEEFKDLSVSICISEQPQLGFYILMISEKEQVNSDEWENKIKKFFAFITDKIFPDTWLVVGKRIQSDEAEVLNFFKKYYGRKAILGKGIYWDNEDDVKNLAIVHGNIRIEKAIQYITANVGKNITRAEVAEILHINEEYFSKLFREYTGKTFKEYVLESKISTAKRLLIDTRLPVSTISIKIGYDNFSYFSKLFKKTTGMTPYEYRKNN